MVFAEQASSTKTAKDGVNTEGDFNFGRFQFDGEKKRHATRPEHALQKLEKEKEKLQQLKQADPKKAAELEEQAHWQRAVKLARGDKLRDDEQLLRKTIKRTTEQKKKSEKAWKEREQTVKEQQEQRQKKRNENIKARIESKKSKGQGGKLPLQQQKKKKQQQKQKKQKQRPGFEGKSVRAKKPANSGNNKRKS
ncbi:surfeit locus protein 6-domain-containing protein [Syncephalis pseudoplumigaleata]|uniref:Surfeit locus protein 6-domain-containing protein n=1 Tax=Syncephalis pseudoplumigaleata TaxID=1712513 RepID=A0A4P9YWT1_9FUNG|nr:surfeit locus protein 6-domain-containing protein [Syncephalis pseudoplumigaleata]|eukprot:RKP23400.1 surfeit locus protein 6-domain-containing protein [Syncephalis pseudoplumigaleata]